MSSGFPTTQTALAEVFSSGHLWLARARAPDDPILAESPAAIATVAAAWASSGLIAAYVLGRRGHEFRTMAVLGCVLGPLFIALAVDIVRHDEDRVRPIVLSAGARAGGPVDILVGLDGSRASPAALRSVLEMLDSRVGRVTLARAIDFQSASDDDWSDAKGSAALELKVWASCVPGQEPARVLVPGAPGQALPGYAVREGYHLLVLSGGWRSRLLRGRRPAMEAYDIPVVILPTPGSDSGTNREARAGRQRSRLRRVAPRRVGPEKRHEAYPN